MYFLFVRYLCLIIGIYFDHVAKPPGVDDYDKCWRWCWWRSNGGVNGNFIVLSQNCEAIIKIEVRVVEQEVRLYSIHWRLYLDMKKLTKKTLLDVITKRNTSLIQEVISCNILVLTEVKFFGTNKGGNILQYFGGNRSKILWNEFTRGSIPKLNKPNEMCTNLNGKPASLFL